MYVIIFLKPIVDMFYQYKLLDYVLMSIVVLCLPLVIRKIKVITVIDILVASIALIYTFTLLRTMIGGFAYIKVISGLLMYFLGRGSIYKLEQCKSSLVLASIIVIGVNAIIFVMGEGFTSWGASTTFKGLYFYKTDLGIAMIQAAAAILFFGSIKRELKFALISMSGLLVLFSNSRASIIIFVCIMYFYYLFNREQKSVNKTTSVSLRVVLGSLFAVTIAIMMVVKLQTLTMFADFHFLGFSDISNVASNTQGRNLIWFQIWESFKSNPIFNQIFGVDLSSDNWNGYESHNSYLKILYNTGYLGLTLFVTFVFKYSTKLNYLRDRELFYFNLSALAIFLIQSISQSSIAFTQMTWGFMFFAGLGISSTIRKKNNRAINLKSRFTPNIRIHDAQPLVDRV